MTDHNSKFRKILNQYVDNRGVAGIAITIGGSANPEVVWVSQSLREEPGFLA